MKLNRYLLLGTLLLLGVGLILGGCGRKDNPFEPNNSVGQGVTEGDLLPVTGITFVQPGPGAEMIDLDATKADIQGEIVILFSKYMNGATLNRNNITIDVQNNTDTFLYYPEEKKLVIHGTWTAAGAWRKIVFKTGVRTAAGLPIDGNKNGKADGSPYDDYMKYYYTGTPTTAEPDTTHPMLTGAGPYGGGVAWDAPLLYFVFNCQDVDTNLVKANVTLVDSTGDTKTIKSGGVTVPTAGSWRVRFHPTAPDSPLVKNGLYYLQLNLNNVQDTHALKATWLNYGYVPNLPTIRIPFRVDTDAAGDYTPLGYSNCAVSGNELLVWFNDSLDYSTINASTIKVFKGSHPNYTGQIYGRIYHLQSDVAVNQFRFTLENAEAGQTYTLWVARTVKDNNGLYLDGNGNGIGGEAGQPDWRNITNWGYSSLSNDPDDMYDTFTP
ncbi:MAG: hypothetical protein MUF78_05135 [Candidatus Edwardsbacteria bacterium]|jgi:hypothetical protein|nr:hypothetical protein [Candidatus Edwardsbacteria bacterium]